MTSESLNIVVFGAGITGLTVARELSRVHGGNVVLLEREPVVGGLAFTFAQSNFSFDTGSHRLHQGYYPEVDQLVRDLCGPDLLVRERKGLIYLRDRPLPYPPSALEILCAFGFRDFLCFSCDFIRARVSCLVRSPQPETFEEFTINRVGKSLYERFYKPYAEKLYGMSPRNISKDPAVSRVRRFTLASLYGDFKRKLRNQRPHYLYPASGIGQLSSMLQQRFLANGGRLLFISRIDKLRLKDDRSIEAVDFTTKDGLPQTLRTDLVISTIPLDALHRLVSLQSDQNGLPRFDLRWRGLRLLCLIVRDKVPCEHETFYFPEGHIVFGRVSELNKYSPALNQDSDRAALTVEIPCSHGDEMWNMPDEHLAGQCVVELRELGILRPEASNGYEFSCRKIPNVYPVYDVGWKERFNKVYSRLNSIDNLYMIGRTALFLHCNIDHCMSMALQLAKYLVCRPRDKKGWERIQQGFFDYRVHE